MKESRSSPSDSDISKLQYTCLFDIGNAQYVVLEPTAQLSDGSRSMEIRYNGPKCFVTIINVKDQSLVTSEWLAAKLHMFRKQDDVFRYDFLHGVLFTSAQEIEILEEAKNLLKSLGTVWIDKLTTSARSLNPGVYLASDQMLHEIRRLYDDSHGCFLASLIPSKTR